MVRVMKHANGSGGFRVGGALAVFASALIGIAPQARAADSITISTGSAAGVYYGVGEALCRALSARAPSLACSVVASDGSVANIMALDPKSTQFAIVQSDVQANAYAGNGLFAGAGADPALRSVYSLHAEALTVVVKADAPYSLVADLKGKKINLGATGTGVRETTEDLLAAFAWSPSDRANMTGLATDKAGKALCAGEIDAAAYVIGHPSKTLMDLSKSCAVKILSMRPEAIQAAQSNAAYYTGVTIPAGLYPNQAEPVTTLGVRATVVTSAQVSEQVVHALTAATFEDLASIKRTSPAVSTLESNQMVRSALTAPWHPGALKYYVERGLVTPEEVAGNAARVKAHDAQAQAKLPNAGAGAAKALMPKIELTPGDLDEDGLSSSIPEERKPKPWESDENSVFDPRP